MMSKLSIFLSITTGSLVVFADLPIFFLFGVVYIGIRIELDKIEKKPYPILSNLFMSSVIGWASSFGVKHYFPQFYQGDIRILTMLVVTLFAYAIVLFLMKNETIQKLVEKYINKFFKDESSSNN